MSYNKGDKVRIIGSSWVPDFTEGVIEQISYDDIHIIKVHGKTLWIGEEYLFKEGTFLYSLIKLFKRKSYAKYKRTH